MTNEEDRIEDAIKNYAARISRAGGVARAKKLSAERRREIAKKAGKASGKVRSAKAKKKHKPKK